MATGRMRIPLAPCLLVLIGALALPMAPRTAFAQADTEIRYMKLDDATVGGRRLAFADKTVMLLHKNHDFEIAGPLHVGSYESGGKKPTKGRWEARYGNTLYVTMEDGSSRAFVFFKIGEKLFLRTVTGGAPNYGDRILSISPMR